MRSPRRLSILMLCCAAVAACGGSSQDRTAASRVPPAKRVCAGNLQAAQRLLAGAQLRVLDHDPTNIECLVSKGSVSIHTVAQASELAWTEYDTAAAHLSQAFGPGAVHVASQLPHPVPGLAGNALWVPAQAELIATNGSQSRGGSYVTVKVKGVPSRSPSSLALATAVARATLRLAPRGSNPPAPS